jgi:hypothetical protein
MLPKWHVLFGALFSLFLFFSFDIGWIASVIVFLSSVFIDIDHYALYVLQERKIHPIGFWDWSMKKHLMLKTFSREEEKLHKESHYVLHGIEILLILVVLTFISEFFLWIFLGFGIHFLPDVLDVVNCKSLLAGKTSQIWLWQRNKKKKKVLR